MERTTMKVGKEWFVVFFISQQTSMKTPGFEFLSDLIKNRMWVLWVWVLQVSELNKNEDEGLEREREREMRGVYLVREREREYYQKAS